MFRFSLLAAAITTTSLGMQSATAEITFSGTVFPATPSEVNAETSLIVGPFNGSGNESPDPRGSVVVDSGSRLEARGLAIAQASQALASMHVTGRATHVTAGDLFVGTDGSGFLRVDDGAWLEIGGDAGAGTATIGAAFQHETLGIGRVEVAGDSTLLTTRSRLDIQPGTVSSLSITDGAVVRAPETGNLDARIGGLLEVIGPRSEFQAGHIVVGGFNDSQFGGGRLLIRDGAVVRPTQSFRPPTQVLSGASLVLDGGILTSSEVQLDGVLQGSGQVFADVFINGGTIRVAAAERLTIDGTVRSSGLIDVTAGFLTVGGLLENASQDGAVGEARFDAATVDIGDALKNDEELMVVDSELTVRSTFGNRSQQSGRLTAERSRLVFYSTLENTGDFQLIDSVMSLRDHTRFENARGDQGAGRLLLSGGVVEGGGECCDSELSSAGLIEARSEGNRVEVPVDGGSLLVTADASIDFARAEFLDAVTVNAGGVARFSADSFLSNNVVLTLAEANRDQPAFVGVADPAGLQDEIVLSLGNRLTVEAGDMTRFAVGEEFLVAEADRLDVFFSEYQLPVLSGTLELIPQLTDTTLSLLVIDTTETLPGDFNGDGAVNAADYTLWRDGELPGGSRWLDHMLWLDNYGRTLALPATNAVPEPLSAVVALLGALAGVGFRRTA